MSGGVTYSDIENMPRMERRAIIQLLIAQRNKENEEYEAAREGKKPGERQSILTRPLAEDEAYGATQIEKMAPSPHYAKRIQKREELEKLRQEKIKEYEKRLGVASDTPGLNK
jgi:hypothetical protein